MKIIKKINDGGTPPAKSCTICGRAVYGELHEISLKERLCEKCYTIHLEGQYDRAE